MSRHTPERKSSHQSSGHSPNDPSLRRRGSLPPDYQDAVHMGARDSRAVPQVTNKRKRTYEDGDKYYGDDEYVTMEVTRREQQEILRRRERDHSSKHHRRRTDSLLEIEQQRHFSMPIGSDDHHHEDRSSSGRDDTIRTTSGVNIFSYAQGGVIRGGRMSAVGRDQTIVHTEVDQDETPVQSRNNTLESKDIRKPRGERDSSAPARKQARAHSPESESPTNTVSLFPFVRNFEITGGEFNAVRGNQSITTYTRSSRNGHTPPAHSTSPFGQDLSKAGPLPSSSPRRTREHYPAVSQERQRAASNKPSDLGSVVSGPSVLAFASGFSFLHSKAQAGSFSAVGGNQTINVGGDACHE